MVTRGAQDPRPIRRRSHLGQVRDAKPRNATAPAIDPSRTIARGPPNDRGADVLRRADWRNDGRTPGPAVAGSSRSMRD